MQAHVWEATEMKVRQVPPMESSSKGLGDLLNHLALIPSVPNPDEVFHVTFDPSDLLAIDAFTEPFLRDIEDTGGEEDFRKDAAAARGGHTCSATD